MKQGEIWLINFNPNRGQEQAGIRPGLIVSGNAMNDHFSLIMVCPLSSKLKFFHGNIIVKPNKITGLKKESEVLTFHIRSISKNRLIKKLGDISKGEMTQVVSYINDRLKY